MNLEPSPNTSIRSKNRNKGRGKRMKKYLFICLLIFSQPGTGAQATETKPEVSNDSEKSEPLSSTTVTDSRLVGHGGPVKSVSISTDGRFALTGSFDYAMMAWDLSQPTPKLLQRFDDHDGAVNAVAFHRDGERIFSASDDGALTLWDLKSGKQLHRFKGHQAKIVNIALSPGGRHVATASWDHTVRVWNVDKKSEIAVLRGHSGPVNAVLYGRYEKRSVIYTAGYDGTIRRWKASDGTLERIVYKHGWGINALAYVSGTDTLVIGALNGSVGLVDPNEGELTRELLLLDGPILSLDLNANGQFLAAGGANGMINVWATKDWAISKSYRNPYGPVWALALNGDANSLYYGGLDDFVTKWQIHPRKPFEPIKSVYPRRFQEKGKTLGERQFLRKCSVCHTLTPDGANRAGPTLYKLFGRPAGKIKDYAYSEAIAKSDIIWNEHSIDQLFFQGPDKFVPGTKMPLQRIADKERRDALIEFLKKATEPPPDTDQPIKKSSSN